MNPILLIIICGIGAGIVGGLFGVGGGIVIVPILVFFMGFGQQMAQGTSIATLLFPIGFLAAYNYHKSGYVNWKFAVIMALTFVVGGFIGSKIAISLDQKVLKRFYAIFMFGVALKMFIDSYRK